MSSGAKNGLKTTFFFDKNMNNGEVVTDTAKRKETLNKGLVKAILVHFEFLRQVNWIKSYSESRLIAIIDEFGLYNTGRFVTTKLFELFSIS